jgi:hypothetical protein
MDEALESWTKGQLDDQANYLFKNNLIDGRVKVALAWVLPGRLCIGRIASATNPAKSYWVISGSVPTDYIALKTAANARDAARHFALKWQMQAERLAQSGSVIGAEDTGADAAGNEMVRKAEALYTLTENDAHWSSEMTESQGNGQAGV